LSTFQCRRCGWCCRNVVINIAYSDIVRWFNEGRNEILQEVSFIDNYPKKGTGGFYIAKTSFNPKQPCPFLGSENGLAVCSIYETRPIVCRDFPYGRDIKTTTAMSCAMYPEPHFILDRTICRQVKKRQFRDFKMAFDNRRQLLNILIVARNE